MVKKKTHEAAKSIWMAPAAWESRCKLIIALAIEIIVGLGTFSFKDQPIKARLEVFASFSYEFAELECKHITHYQTNRVHYAEMQIDIQLRVLKGNTAVYARLFLFTHPRTSRKTAVFERPYAPFSREIAKLRSLTDWLESTR